MGFIEKHHGKYRARYRDASGRLRSKSFTLKADAERFVREEEVALERGSWIDPRAAEMTLAEWCERFMSLARRRRHHAADVPARLGPLGASSVQLVPVGPARG